LAKHTIAAGRTQFSLWANPLKCTVRADGRLLSVPTAR